MTQSIAFHSYKGGTGKTTIAANLAAVLATKGYNVSLIDLDVYAPSLQTYFDYSPDKWINDFLSDNANVSDVMIDMTSVVEKLAATTDSHGKKNSNMGKLWVGFSNPQKEEVYKLEGSAGKQPNARIQLLRKFIQLREDLISEYNSDYVIIDTSPGIRFWSINSLAVADTLFLTLKFGDLDIEGTKKIARDIYASFEKFGAKSYVLLNRVAGYCVPHTLVEPQYLHDKDKLGKEGDREKNTPTIEIDNWNQSDFNSTISKEVGIGLISTIPCYCDIQFSRKEFLTVVQQANHPFSKQLERLASAKEIKV